MSLCKKIKFTGQSKRKPKAGKNGAKEIIQDGSDFQIICCDCGLSHRYLFEKHKKGLLWTTYRDDVETDKERKQYRYVAQRYKKKFSRRKKTK